MHQNVNNNSKVLPQVLPNNVRHHKAPATVATPPAFLPIRA